MARTIEEIQVEMMSAKEKHYELAGLKSNVKVVDIFQKIWNYFFKNKRSTSKVAIWRLWIYIISFSHHTQEELFDEHTKYIDKKLKEDKRGRLPWYRKMALNFQYGFKLIEDTDFYDNSGYKEEDIEASKIIKYAAVTQVDEIDTNKRALLVIKIATESDGKLSPVNETQYEAFKAYVNEFKFAGVYVRVINYLPDLLKLKLRIVRDVLILDSNGMNRKTGEYPVNNVIEKFMKELPFNGQFSLQRLEEKILAVDGVKDLNLDYAETAWIDANKNGYGAMELIDIAKIPISGYFTINLTEDNDTKSTITYV